MMRQAVAAALEKDGDDVNAAQIAEARALAEELENVQGVGRRCSFGMRKSRWIIFMRRAGLRFMRIRIGRLFYILMAVRSLCR